jgi:methionyl-tRNA formyltransferase
MKIGYFGDGPWAHLALERILADPRFEVVFIVPRFDARDPVLQRQAELLGVDFLLLEDINAPESVERLRRFGAELFVSMSYNQIFRHPAIAAAPQGIINCHAGALPFYRGRNILNWALINDAKSFGVTVHEVNEGVDAGDIIVQRILPISDDDDYGTLLSRAVVACAEALSEALDLIVRGQAVRTRQSSIHPVGSYFGRRRPGDEWIDWNWPSRRIFNFVRALTTPGPGARTLRANETIEIFGTAPIEHAVDYLATTGEVVGTTSRGAVVKTGDSTLLLTDVRSASARPLCVGTRLGSDPLAALAALKRRVRDLERTIVRLEQSHGNVPGGVESST